MKVEKSAYEFDKLVPIVSIFLSFVFIPNFAYAGLTTDNLKPQMMTSPSGSGGGVGGAESYSNDLWTGAATFTVPIVVPPGRNGMQPNLVLQYNSRQGNGIWGVGWDMPIGYVGISTKYGQPKYDGTDPYEYSLNGLGGGMLVNMGSNSGTTLYRAKVESKYVIFKQVSESEWQANDSQGYTYTFGQPQFGLNSQNQTVNYRWYLTQIQDSHGNQINFSYTRDPNYQIYPSKITYSVNEIDFIGDPNGRSDTLNSSIAGYPIYTLYRMNEIDVKSNGNLVRQYRLNYTMSTNSQRSLIHSIQQYGNDGQTKLPATQFSYNNASTHANFNYVGSILPAVPSWSGPTTTTPVGNNCLEGDFNGDGKMDIACDTGDSSGYDWAVSLSNGNGFDNYTWTGPFNLNSGIISRIDNVSKRCLTGDFNGDGKTDIACQVQINGVWMWFIALSMGNKFVFNLNNSMFSNLADFSYGNTAGDYCITGNFSSSNKTDITCWDRHNSTWVVATSTDGFNTDNTSNWGSGPTPSIPIGSQCFVGDFNGDSLSDILCYSGVGTKWMESFSTGQGFNSYYTNIYVPGSPARNWCYTGDFNGDGLSDIACYNNSGSQWLIYESMGIGGFIDVYANLSVPSSPASQWCVPGDFIGEGKTDIACYTNSAFLPLYGYWNVGISTDSGFSSFQWSYGPISSSPIGNKCLVGDFAGNGTSAIACYTSNGSWWNMGLPNISAPDLLVHIDNGMGGTTDITYTPSSNYSNSYFG